jgi:hypothetical protein
VRKCASGVLEEKLERRNPFGKRKLRWELNIKIYFQVMIWVMGRRLD